MSGYRPPSSPAAAPPPNRAQPAGRRTLLLWVVLIAIFVAVYNVFGQQPAHREPVAEDHPEPQPTGPAALFLLPLAVALGFAIRLHGLRFAPGEIPVIPPAPPAPTEPIAPSHAPVRLEGRSEGARASLTLELSAVQWQREGRLLSTPQAMEIPWVDVEALRFHTSAVARTWAVMIGLCGIAWGVSGKGENVAVSAGALVVAALLWIAGGRWRRTTAVLVTRSHVLQLHGGNALREVEQAALAALYQHRPELKPGESTGILAFLRDQATAAFASDATLERRVRTRLAPRDLSAEELARTVRMTRVIALWNSGWTLWLPVSTALAWSLSRTPDWLAVVPFAVLSVVGAVIGMICSARFLKPFARWMNIPVVTQPAPAPAAG